MDNIKIVVDSSADTLDLPGVPFACVPMKVITSEKEYVDDEHLDIEGMVEELLQYSGKSTTSCPSVGDWLEAFGDATEIFCVTITSAMSGSFNAANMAKQAYEQQHPERRVHLVDTLSAGPGVRVVIEKLHELIASGKSFDEIYQLITDYQKNTGLVFVLESLKNLANNGRVSPIVAKLAAMLGIRLVGKASAKGELEPLDKIRGERKSCLTLLNHMKLSGFIGGKVRIAHCSNQTMAQKLKELIATEFASAQIEIYKCRGLCSFYAEKGGMLVGFEC